MTISAVIITHNEEKNILRCLLSLKFCDEIVVVDANSTDRTREIVQGFTSHVYQRDWSSFADQRNFAKGKATSDWILSIDADEEVSDGLRKELQALRLARSPSFQSYSIPRKTFHFDRWIRYGGWYPNRLVRFFHKDSGNWKGDELHEYWESSGSVGKLNGDLLHYSFENLADQVDRNNRYSTLGAIKLGRSGVRFSVLRLGVKTVSKFIETYFLKLGILDGYPGLIISVSASYSVFLKWAKLWEFNLAEKKKS